MRLPPALRHVPSPDWRDQIAYFVATDRLTVGDARVTDDTPVVVMP